MAGQIGDDKIHEVRERTDIVELVSSYVSLKRSGANHMGLCPFHAEKSPSFSVHGGRQFFHCFGCGVGGDAFSFLMKIEGLSFPDATRKLAERAGIDLEERQLSPEEERRQQERERLFKVNEQATNYFHRLLMEGPSGEPGRQYLKRRGYGRKCAGEYQLGYAVDSWEGLTSHLGQQGVNPQDARALGLIRPGKEGRGDYDLFRGRLIFPIHDLAGRVVAFGGRVLDDGKPKYINSPESPIYHKGQVLFGLYQARQAMRQAGEVILVEGYFDQLALNRSGFLQAVATCGTALTVEHAKLLKRYVQRVLLLFDQDAAGRQATFKAMEVLQAEGLPAAVIDLAAGEDPDSFLRQEGGEIFRQRLEQAQPAMELFIAETLSEVGGGIEGTVRGAEIIVGKLAQLASELEQDLYLKALAERTGIELELLKGKLEQARQQRCRQEAQPRRVRAEPSGPDAAVAPPSEPPPELPPEPLPAGEPPGWAEGRPVAERPPVRPVWSKAVVTLLSLLLHESAAREQILGKGVAAYFPEPELRLLAQRLLDCLEGAASGEEPERLTGLSEELRQQIEPLRQVDREAFAGTMEEMLEDCRRAVEQEGVRRRYAELPALIAQAEKSDDTALQAELMREFTQLKKRLN